MDQWDVPEGHGLLIQLQSDGSLTINAVPDKHYPHIHPNCYAPANLENVRLLPGGGSGTAVFGGRHPTMQAIVMKHGGPKDTKEVFSLATIAAELLQRATSQSESAASDMNRRIPEFVMVYISPYHLRDRDKELWAKLRTIQYTSSGRRVSIMDHRNVNHHHRDHSRAATDSCDRRKSSVSDNIVSGSELYKRWKLHALQEAKNPSKGTIRVTMASHRQISWCVSGSSVDITLPRLNDNGQGEPGLISKTLQSFCNELIAQQELHNWKVTLTQKWIGGPEAVNGADILTSGNLQGALLDTLIREFTCVMQDLDRLTLPEERMGRFELVQKEVERLKITKDIRDVSNTIDLFVGRAISKNFHPDHGRFRNLRLLGDDFQAGDFFLTEAEQVPARFLGMIMQYGSCMDEIFDDAPFPKSALDEMEDRGWLDIIIHATQFHDSSSAAATDYLWTCGLTDAGLHNTFLSVEGGLEIFDLGEPGLQTRPAFLTKFLMSFFHTLGMESDGKTSWKIRFCVVQQDGRERLSLTQETEEKIPYLYTVFGRTFDNLMEHIFNDDDRVRELLIKYIVLQLLSDASFCLQRWEAKGGGTQRYGERLNYAMEAWLWRSLWDQYIASHVYAHLLLQPEAI